MIFLTVGTQFPFDRLVEAVDKAAEAGLVYDEIYAQIGKTTYKPQNFSAVQTLEKSSFDTFMQSASAVISHAGMGTITMALELCKPLLVLPRLHAFGEVVNDHQIAIAEEFERQGYLLAAYNTKEVMQKIPQLQYFIPVKRESTSAQVAARISNYLSKTN